MTIFVVKYESVFQQLIIRGTEGTIYRGAIWLSFFPTFLQSQICVKILSCWKKFNPFLFQLQTVLRHILSLEQGAALLLYYLRGHYLFRACSLCMYSED